MAGFTTGQAGATLQPTSVPTAYTGDAQELARSQRLAQMLMSSEMPQGQMVSGRFVAPNIFQNIAKLVDTGTGAYFADKAEKQQLDLARKIREGEQGALQDYMNVMQGRPAVGDQPAVASDPRMANMRIAQDERAPSWLRQHAITQITKPPQFKEVSKVNQATGNTEIFRYDINASDPLSTMQFLGIAKPALSRADEINFADKGINTNIVGGNAQPVNNLPNANAPVGGGAQVTPVKANVKPSTNATSQDLVKTYGYDPFKLPEMPPQPSGEAAREWKKNAYKPLEGTAGQKVDGAKMYYNSLEKYNNYVSTLTASDLANPSVRSRLDSLYATAKLTGKEANNLGVLNGGDERILEEVLPNYKNITVTKKNLDKIIQDQKEFASGIIVEAYGTQQKVVPENMRKFVVVPKEVTTEKEKSPKSTKTVVRTGVVQDGPNKGKKITQYSDGTTEYR
jgi:hypothetical protein